MIQVAPHWTSSYASAEDLMADIPDMVYTGPGFYLGDDYTILIVSFTETVEKAWSKVYAKGQRLRAAVWQCPYSETIFPHLVAAPIRQDQRTETPQS